MIAVSRLCSIGERFALGTAGGRAFTADHNVRTVVNGRRVEEGCGAHPGPSSVLIESGGLFSVALGTGKHALYVDTSICTTAVGLYEFLLV